MAVRFSPAALVHSARLSRDLSQRDMARRAGTAQSVVARIESGDTDPGGGTLARLLEAAGYELRCELTPIVVPDTHMLDDVTRILAMTPEERLHEVRNFGRFVAAARPI